MNTNELTKEIILNKMMTNPKWLLAGVVAIYNKQTENEKNAESTQEDNGIGFNGCDGQFGTSIAKKILAGYSMSPKQLAALQKMMKKYAGQLLRIAKEKSLQSA